MIKYDGYKRALSDDSVIVVAHDRENLVLFDDTEPLRMGVDRTINGTVELKARFIKDTLLAGVLIHAIDMDDVTGQSCERGPFPITTVVARIFIEANRAVNNTAETTTTSTAQSTTTTSTVQSTMATGQCAGVQKFTLIPDENDCRFYFVCSPNVDKPVAHIQCPDDLRFSASAKACTHEDLVSHDRSSFDRPIANVRSFLAAPHISSLEYEKEKTMHDFEPSVPSLCP